MNMADPAPKILGIEMRPCEDGTAWELKGVIIRPGKDGFYYYTHFINGTHHGCTADLKSSIHSLENVILNARKNAKELGT